MRENRYALPVLNLLGFLGTVVVNGLAVTLPINGMSTGALSDKYENLFVPAGLTFSIWGLIYLLLGLFVVYQLAVARRDSADAFFTGEIGLWFLLTCIANMGWIFAWHYELLALSLGLMLLLLGSLLFIYLRLGIGVSSVPGAVRYLVHLPFSVYLGWITIATIANVTALLVSVGWNGFGIEEQYWAVAVIVVGVVIAIAMLITRRDIFFALVVDWALLGIALKRMALANPAAYAVLVAAIAGIVVVSIGILIQVIRRRVYGPTA
ncbi:MAG: hypothetical protein JW846_06535 [Dehalococcoidia bacterium]|nr:hypothetical protein [Dehalococcoidia bacterium]